MRAMRQAVRTPETYSQTVIPSATMFAFLVFAFLMAATVVCSVVPVYLSNQSVAKTRFVLTTVRMSNYTLQMHRSLGKRELSQAWRLINETSLVEMQLTMNTSIQASLAQQLQGGDSRDRFNIIVLQMLAATADPSNMSVVLDFIVVYTRECIACDRRRQLVIYERLCSSSQLPMPISFLVQFANQSYSLSAPVIVYTPSIAIGNIVVTTQIISKAALIDSPTSNNTNGSTQVSSKLQANNYTWTIATAKSNYLATLDEAVTGNSAVVNAGPVSLVGALTMYPSLTQLIERQAQGPNGSNALNVTISNIILQFWYSNSTVQVLIDFVASFSTSCDDTCMNQRSNQLATQLGNLTGPVIFMQPTNISNGQVRLWKNGALVLYDYSLTAQVIANCSGTIARVTSPTLPIVY